MGAPEMYPEAYRDHLTGDPAYDKAFAALADCPSFAQVERALKTYAHELAKKIRDVRDNYDLDMHPTPWAAMDYSAYLIDPEVSCVSGCTCACHTADPSPCDDCSKRGS